MPETGPIEALRSLDRPWGEHARDLALGPWLFRLEGLDDRLVESLERRWAGFLGPPSDASARVVVRAYAGDGRLGPLNWRPGDRHRMEAESRDGRTALVRSFSFALGPESAPGAWRVGLVPIPQEPLDRVCENVVRYLLARVAAEEGGLGMHGAGVLREGRAFVFAGPSRSGKTTAVSLSSGASLGDDFSVVFPSPQGWSTVALPFDSSESAPPRPAGDRFSLAGIWRLFQAPEPRVERLPAVQATASLMGCAAFPWAMPDLAETALEHARAIVSAGLFAHLHFAKSPGFWGLIA